MGLLGNIVKKVLGKNFILPFTKGTRFVFVYHDISNTNEQHFSEAYSTTISQFEAQIELLQSLFKIVPLSLIVDPNELDNTGNYAAITFDDGFQSVYTNARPIMNEKKIPYTVFFNKAALENDQLWVSNLVLADDSYQEKLSELVGVNVGEEDAISSFMTNGQFSKDFVNSYQIENPNFSKVYMGLEEMEQLSKEDVIIGNHSSDHLALASIADSALMKDQIEGNKSFLEKESGKTVQHFALPFGKKNHYSSKVVELITHSGHTHIYTTNPNRFNSSYLNSSNLIPRIGVTTQSKSDLMFLINRTFLTTYDL